MDLRSRRLRLGVIDRHTHRYGSFMCIDGEQISLNVVAGGRQVVEPSAEILDKVSLFLRHHDAFVIQFSLRQSSNSVGTILSFGREHIQYVTSRLIITIIKYKLMCPRGTQTCALAVANIAHAVREMLHVAKRPIPQG